MCRREILVTTLLPIGVAIYLTSTSFASPQRFLGSLLPCAAREWREFPDVEEHYQKSQRASTLCSSSSHHSSRSAAPCQTPAAGKSRNANTLSPAPHQPQLPCRHYASGSTPEGSTTPPPHSEEFEVRPPSTNTGN